MTQTRCRARCGLKSENVTAETQGVVRIERRVRAQDEAQVRAPEPADSESSVTSEEPEQGWDPYDVWLRRVHLLRSRGGSGSSEG